MEICGAIEFKMDKKSYRMIPLAKSEDYLYSKQSLKRARQVWMVYNFVTYTTWHDGGVDTSVTLSCQHDETLFPSFPFYWMYHNTKQATCRYADSLRIIGMCTHFSSCACWRMPYNHIIAHTPFISSLVLAGEFPNISYWYPHPHTPSHFTLTHSYSQQVNDKVLHRKRAKFHSWHSQWLSSNLTTQESTLCTDWLLGKAQQPLRRSPEGVNGAVTTGSSSPLTECTKELYLGVERSRYTTRPRKQPPPPSASTSSTSTSTSGPAEPPEPMSTD